MKCRSIQDLLPEYASGELTGSRRSDVISHIAECDACRAEAIAMEKAMSSLARPLCVFDPPDVLHAVKAQVAAPARRSLIPAWAFGGAVAVLLVTWMVSPLNEPRISAPEHSIVQAPISREVSPPVEENDVRESPLEPIVVPVKESGDPVPRPPITTRPKPVRNVTPVAEPAPAAIDDTEPTIECLIVYMPEPPTEEMFDAYWSDVDRIARDMNPDMDLPVSSDTATYSIRMEDAGEVTTLTVRTETEPGLEPSITVEYAVDGPDDRDERSLNHEGPYMPVDHIAHIGVG